MIMKEDDKLPFLEHLEELRKRLIVCAVAVLIGFCIAYGFKEVLFEILTQPLIEAMETGEKLVFTGIAEAFFTYLKVAFLAGLMLAAPVILYEFWMFVAPGLYVHEKHVMLPIVFLSSFFFIGGALFGYFIVFPLGFKFFLAFASETIRPLPSMREYLSFSSSMLLAFGAVFELPLILVFLVRLGVITINYLKKNRKYAILVIFIVAAILTPPDVISQIMMAIPLMILYELSIIGAKIFGKKKSEESEEHDNVEK